MVKLAMSCIKYMLFLFNLVFVLGGLFLITIGVIIKLKGVTIFGDPTYVSMPIIIISTGVVTFLLAFMGCCGAIKESILKLSLFGILLILLLILQIAGIAVGFLHLGQMDAFIRESMKHSLSHQERDAAKAWDRMQTRWNCCGVEGPKDYEYADNTTLPASCCSKNSTDACSASNAFEDGCYQHLVEFIFNHLVIFGGGGGIIAIVELVSVVFTFCLVSGIRNENKARSPSPRSPFRY